MKISFTQPFVSTNTTPTLWRSLWVGSLLVIATWIFVPDASHAVENDVDQDEATEADDDDSMAAIFRKPVAPLPEVVSGRFVVPPLEPRSTATDDIGNGSIPKGFRGKDDAPIEPLPEIGYERDLGPETGNWSWSTIQWTAANTFSNPRYFEDRMLERHGHERWGHLQPLASGARFFTTLPLLPYKMAIQDPCECEYTLGYYRSGSCAPMVYQRPPWDRRAILAESAAVATGMLIIP